MQISQRHKDWYARGLAAMGVVLAAVKRGDVLVDSKGGIWATTFRGVKCEPFRMESRVGNYWKVYFTENGIQYGVHAHRLVWIVLKGEIELGAQINHIDGDGQNNNPVNLEVVDHAGNQQHRRKILGKGGPNPPRHVGEAHPQAKLTWEKVREMRRLFREEGRTASDLMREYGVKHSQALRIVKNQSWIE